MSEEKLARKILRSLRKRFEMKVTAIEEARDLSRIKVDELIGSLQTFEMSINEWSEKKNKGISFVSNTKEVRTQGDEEEILEDDITLLNKEIQQFLEISGLKVEDNCSRQKGLTSFPLTKIRVKTNPMVTRVLSALNVKTMNTLKQNVLYKET